MKKTIRSLSKAAILPAALHILLDLLHYLAPIEKDNIGTLWVSIVIFAVSLPLYFFIKGNTPHPWLYPIVTFAFVQLFYLLAHDLIYANLPDWTPLSYFAQHLIRSGFFALAAVIDFILMVIKKIQSQTE